MHRRGRPARPLMVASLLLALGCGGSSETIGPPSAIEITAGNNQQSTVGQPLPVTPTARVRDKDGHNLSAITVRFTVVSGGGTIAADTAITDANGVVVLPSWTLGTRSGANTLKVQASGLTTSVTVNATGTAAAPSNLATVDQVNFAALVQTQVTGQPTVLVTDGFGNPVGGVIVTFSVSLNNGSLTGAAPTTDAAGHASLAGWTLGSTVGVNRVTASASGTNSVQFEAQGLSAAPTIVSTSPTTQAGILGAMVPRVPQVRVTNSLGQILGGVPVRFAISGGGDATVLGPLAVSDPITGIAAPTDWRLGPASTSSTVIATLPGFPGSSVTFNATGTFSPFLIDVRFLSSATPAQRDAFASAAARWMQIIVGDIPDVPVSLAVGTCATGASPAMNETIDDVVIFAQVTGIDGVGGILGSAGPCIRRSTGLFTAVGSMRFDMADLVGLQNTNRLEPVILHEMAHVLGFGTIWTEKGVLVGAGGADPVFTGAEALSVWPSFNLGYAGTPVPVENLFGAGTRDSHWRESVLVSELMTGFIEAPGVPTPLSRLTIASFKDLGYSISYSTADAYAGNLMAAMREAGAGARTPINDIVENAQWEVTPLGIVRRIH